LRDCPYCTALQRAGTNAAATGIGTLANRAGGPMEGPGCRSEPIMRIPVHLFMAALGLVSMTSAAGAQILPPDIQRELEMTDLRIERAETIVSGSNNDAARLELEQAVSLQSRAKEEFAAGHPRIALDLTYRARGHAD